MTTRTLAVPGATITYDVTGSGPVLLLIPGGPADATGFAPIRPLLAEDHTVVTFDPRGISRSPLDGEPGDHTLREHGIGAAIGAFAKMSGFDITPPTDPTPEELARMKVMEGNFAYFFGHLMAAIGAYDPDLDALRAVTTRLVVGVGEKAAGLPAHEAGLGLAADLGLTAELFPGDHGGFLAEPVAFAARLREVLKES
ncbi:alpha/beta hydrolase [Amycolatopsis sp. NBC_00355]|uniref:alpha/beta fold hydrolase n=1 Tax=Amycolatopsis sp. NBC_00355 TaxID=2975957 RepID=UPI002E27560E